LSQNPNNIEQVGKRRLTTIVAVDICDYSKFSEIEELSAIKLMDDVFAIGEKLVGRFKGRIFKVIADALLVEFPSTRDAVYFADSFRQEISYQKEWPINVTKIETRTGIHVGDVVDRPDGDILGHGVNVAVRLQESAPRGGIIISSNVFNLLPDNIGLNLSSGRKIDLKNIEKPINTYLVEQEFSWKGRLKENKTLIAKALLGLILMASAFFYYSQYKAGSTGRSEISSVAVSATLHNLRQSPYPISDMFAALNTTNSFDGALYFLIEKYNKKLSAMSDKDKINLLHQIASLAVNRNSPEAEKAYRKILSIKGDPEALLQLAIILRKRGDIVQARDFLRRASKAVENIGYSPERILLAIEIESAVLNGQYGPDGNFLQSGSTVDLLSAEMVLAKIAASEQANSHNDIRLRASYNALVLQFMSLYKTDDNNPDEGKLSAYLRIIDDLKSIIDEQINYNFLYDLSESYATLSTIQNIVRQYDDSIYTLEQSLDIEERLVRPSKTIAAHANLAYAYVASHSEETEKLIKAEYHIKKVREISAAENRVNREYYNLYVLALVENKRSNKDKSCSYFDSARLLWPKSSLPKGFLPKLDKDLGCNFYTGVSSE